MIVVDASAVIEVLLATAAAVRIEDRIFSSTETLHAPHLLDLEVAQVLRRFCAAGDMEPDRARLALTDLGDLPLYRHPHEPFLARIWELRHNLTAYDGAYVALAEALPATLLTGDARLAAAPGHEAVIEVI